MGRASLKKNKREHDKESVSSTTEEVYSCAVPGCLNNSAGNPSKLFVFFPRILSAQESWFKAMGLGLKRISYDDESDEKLVCCEDHFNVEDWVDNCEFYCGVTDCFEVLKENVVPNRFSSKNKIMERRSATELLLDLELGMRIKEENADGKAGDELNEKMDTASSDPSEDCEKPLIRLRNTSELTLPSAGPAGKTARKSTAGVRVPMNKDSDYVPNEDESTEWRESAYSHLDLYKSCFVPGCLVDSAGSPDIEFFRFPEERTLKRAQWMAALRKRDQKTNPLYVCERHFNADDYIYGDDGPKILKPSSVPHLLISKKKQKGCEARLSPISEFEQLKSCIVPHCPNTNLNSPTKEFLCVPLNLIRRKMWFSAIHKPFNHELRKSVLYCCDDHFEPSDLEVYAGHSMGHQAMRKRVKDGALPQITKKERLDADDKLAKGKDGYSASKMCQYPTCNHNSDQYKCRTLTMVDITSFYSEFYNLPNLDKQNAFIFQQMERVSPTPFLGEIAFKFYIKKRTNNRTVQVPVCMSAFIGALSLEITWLITIATRHFDRMDELANQDALMGSDVDFGLMDFDGIPIKFKFVSTSPEPSDGGTTVDQDEPKTRFEEMSINKIPVCRYEDLYDRVSLCLNCLSQFKSLKEYQTHRRAGCPQKRLTTIQCRLCSRIFAKIAHLQLHIFVVHKYICIRCNKTFRYMRLLKPHLEECNGVRIVAVPVKAGGLIEHESNTRQDEAPAKVEDLPLEIASCKSETGLLDDFSENNLVIDELSEETESEDVVKVHNQTPAAPSRKRQPKGNDGDGGNRKIAICFKCRTTCLSLCSLRAHMKNSCSAITKEKKPIICLSCNVNFSSEIGLGLHLKRSEDCRYKNPGAYIPGVVSKDVNTSSVKKKRKNDTATVQNKVYMCTKCSATFSSVWGLRTHERNSPTCKPDKPYSFPTLVDRSEAEKAKQLAIERGLRPAPCPESQTPRIFTPGPKPFSPEMAHSCKTCKATFTSVWGLRTHERISSICNPMGKIKEEPNDDGQANFDCGSPSTSQDVKSAFDDSLITKTWKTFKGPHKCSNCNESFAKLKILRKHFITSPECNTDLESDTGRFPCPKCPSLFKTRTGIEQHFATHAPPKDVYSCQFCDESEFNSVSELLKHSHWEHPGKWVCAECNSNFTSFPAYYVHISCEHNPYQTELKFSCDSCQRRFSKKKSFEVHYERCSDALSRIYDCSICRRKFTRKIHLSNHIKFAHDGHPFDHRYKIRCPDCPRSFTSHEDLNRHVEVVCQKEDEPLSCDHCSGVYLGKCALKAHMTSTHSHLNPLVSS